MSFISDVLFGGAEKKAAEAGLAGTREGIAEQRRQFDTTREDLAPFVGAGQDALGPLRALLGIDGPEAEQGALDNFIESPGQAFLRKRGERATLRNASATGGLGGGNVLKALTEFGIGTAATQLGERKDRLQQVAGLGSGTGTRLGAIGANTAANIGNLATVGGQIEGQGITGRASGIRRGLSNVGKILRAI